MELRDAGRTCDPCRSVDPTTTLEDVGWTHVDLRHHHEHGNVQRQGQTQMLFGHPHDPRVAAHLGRRGTAMASRVLKAFPLLLLTISMQKSGRCPVIPNTVVFRYFSCPARSMKVMTLEDFSQILVQSRLPP